jgi:hypothetical protein
MGYEFCLANVPEREKGRNSFTYTSTCGNTFDTDLPVVAPGSVSFAL